MTQKNSIKTYVWNSSTHSNTSDFIAPTPLSGRGSTDIKVKVGSTILTSGYTLTVDSSNVAKVRFQALPNNGDPIRIYRETKHDGRLVDFVDGSLLTSETLDLDSTQLFNMAQEAYDKSEETTIGRESFYYSQGTDPTSDAANIVNTGALWYDTSSSTNTLQVWSGTEWQATAPAKVTKKYGTTTAGGKTAVVSHPTNGAFSQFTDAAFTSGSSLYLNGVKLVETTSIYTIPSEGDYTVDSGTVTFLDLSSASDILVSETFDGSFSSSVTASEANALDYKNQAVQSSTGAAQSATSASDFKDEAEDEKNDAAKYASNPKNSTFSTHDNSATGQYSAKHYAETAADSASTATGSTGAGNSKLQTVGTDLQLGSNSKIKQVSDKLDKVEDVADKILEVEDVSLKLNEITALSPTTVLDDIGTVAGKASEIGTLAGVAPAISTVSNMVSADITKVADIDDKVTAVANIDQKVVDVYNIRSQIGTLTTGTNLDKVEDVANDINDVRTVASLEQDINTLAADSYKNVIETVAETNYKQKVEALAEDAYKLKVETATSPEYKTDIETVADSTFKAEIGTVADAVSEVKNLSASTGNMATLVSKLGQTTDLAGAVTDAQNSATSASSSASTATTQATAASGSASTAATHAANLGSVAYQDLTAIAETKSVIATDVFVYDTSNDSDGGAWRNRTQGTSWYNEALNTSSRGATKKFPAVAVIVLEDTKLTIYDADDPSMPMWMVFSTGSDNSTGVTLYKMMVTGNLNAVTMKNGLLCVGRSSLVAVDFVADRAAYGNLTYVGDFSGHTIAQRNEYGLINNNNNWLFTGFTVQPQFNDIAVTVLPNAPIDPDTGLPVPTIAVAGDYGVSVIKDDGSVVDITASSYTLSSRRVKFLPNNKLYFSADGNTSANNRAVFVEPIPEADLTYLGAEWQNASNVYERYIPTVGGAWTGDMILAFGSGGSTNIACTDTDLVLSNAKGMARISRKEENPSEGMQNITTSSYNTGWMSGDTKLATLMDTTAETISAPELVTNGDFSSFGSDIVSNGDFSNGTTGWEANNTSIAVTNVNGRLRVQEDGGTYTARGLQQLTTEVGKIYRVTYDVYPDTASASSAKVYISINASTSNSIASGSNHVTAITGKTIYFKATTTTHRILLTVNPNNQNGAFADFDNIKVEEVSGWELHNSLANLEVTSSGKAKVTALVDGAFSCLTQPITTVIGKTYIATADIGGGTVAGRLLIGNNGNSGYVIGDAVNNQTVSETFVAQATTTYITAQVLGGTNGQYFEVDNISLTKAEPDRSVNNNPLNIVGNVTKEAVATGAELVGYKVPTGGGYLEDNTFAPPTEDFCYMWWSKDHNNDRTQFYIGGLSNTEAMPPNGINVWSFGDNMKYRVCGRSFDIANAGTQGVTWSQHCVISRDRHVEIWINGELKGRAEVHRNDVIATGIHLMEGYYSSNHSGGMALFRVSATAPTPEQIAKIYRDEKPLFQEGAKCTLYGDYDEVKALAYDEDTEILHAGTAGDNNRGRSEFKGLQRISNTTGNVTVAISAANGLVVEE